MQHACKGEEIQSLLHLCSTGPDAILACHDHSARVQEWADSSAPGMRDVFDFPDGEPSELFINPFACAVDPDLWRELQVLHRYF